MRISVWLGVIVAVTTGFRALVYISGGAGVAVTFSGINYFNGISDLIVIGQTALPNVLYLIVNMVGRVESAQSLILASQYDVNNVFDEGILDVWLRFIWEGFVALDADKHHLEYIATTLPVGYVSIGGFWSKLYPLYGEIGLGFFLSAAVIALYLRTIQAISISIYERTFRYGNYMLTATILTLFMLLLIGKTVFLGLLLTSFILSKSINSNYRKLV